MTFNNLIYKRKNSTNGKQNSNPQQRTHYNYNGSSSIKQQTTDHLLLYQKRYIEIY